MSYNIEELQRLTEQNAYSMDDMDLSDAMNTNPNFIAEKNDFFKNVLGVDDFDADAFTQKEIQLKKADSLDENLRKMGVKVKPAIDSSMPDDFLAEAMKKKKQQQVYANSTKQVSATTSGKSDMLLEQILLELRNLNKNLTNQQNSAPKHSINESADKDKTMTKEIIRVILALKNKGVL